MAKITELMEVIVYARDMNALVGFYRDTLGLSVTYPAGVVDFGRESWVTFDTGRCVLALHAGGKGRLGEDAPKVVFRVNDIEAARRDLLERRVRLGEIRNPAPGVWVVDGVDPEGNKLSLEAHSAAPSAS